MGMGMGMGMDKPPTDCKKNIYFVKRSLYRYNCSPYLFQDGQYIIIIQKYTRTKLYILTIPPGIDDGEIIKHKGKGNIINKHKGDVKINISIKEDDLFTRDGINLIYTKNITLKEALCGFYIELTHLNGKSYKINNTDVIIYPSFIKSVSNHGMKRNGMTGDLIIKFKIKFPDSLEPNVIEQLKQLL